MIEDFDETIIQEDENINDVFTFDKLSKGEVEFRRVARSLNVEYEREYRIVGRKGNRYYDFKIGNTLIEIDGQQHFKGIYDSTNVRKEIDNDIYKTKLALNNNFNIVRISSSEIYNLDRIINNIVSDNKSKPITLIGKEYNNEILKNYVKVLSDYKKYKWKQLYN